jgi:hypothetical protein
LIKGNIWTGYESYLVDVPPFTIKITETIFDPFYEYFFDEENDLPYYYGDVRVGDLKFCLHYKS